MLLASLSTTAPAQSRDRLPSEASVSPCTVPPPRLSYILIYNSAFPVQFDTGSSGRSSVLQPPCLTYLCFRSMGNAFGGIPPHCRRYRQYSLLALRLSLMCYLVDKPKPHGKYEPHHTYLVKIYTAQYGIGWAHGNVAYASTEFAGYLCNLGCFQYPPLTFGTASPYPSKPF